MTTQGYFRRGQRRLELLSLLAVTELKHSCFSGYMRILGFSAHQPIAKCCLMAECRAFLQLLPLHLIIQCFLVVDFLTAL